MRAACRPPAWAYQACAEPGDKLRGRTPGRVRHGGPTSAQTLPQLLRLHVCTLQPALPHPAIWGALLHGTSGKSGSSSGK
eukprot:scaffold18277_cov61-Phaeocystis_antarctica.AAC.3